MKRSLHIIFFVAFFFLMLPGVYAQTNQSWNNGETTTPINFVGGCTYAWTNDNPSIGLAPSGTGNIAAFTAVNAGSTPVTATITVTPTSSTFMYIANAYDNTLEVINTVTHDIVARIPTDKYPVGVSVSTDGSKVYVSDENPAGQGSVSVISTLTNKVIATIATGTNSWGIVASPDGKWVYVANEVSNSVSVIDAVNNILFKTIPITPGATGVAISPDGSRVYIVTGYNTDANLVVINTSTNTVLTTIPIGGSPWTLALSPDGSNVYVANAGLNSLQVISTSTYKITASTPSLNFPAGVVVSHDGTRVYVANNYGNEISIISTSTHKVIGVIPDGSNPEGVSISPDGKYLYVNNNNSNNVAVFDTQTNSKITSISIGASGDSQTIGNFLSPNMDCTSSPFSFTITVKPTPGPNITIGPVTGVISACKGTASASPDIEQFNASGTNLTGDITVTAPAGFEVSRNSDQGYSSSLILTQSLGVVTSSLIFVRSAATAPVGNNVMGNITLSSPGATDQPVAVTATIYGIPIADVPTPQIKVNGAMTDPVFFKGSASSYTWVNNTTGIGLAASGTGDIPSFTVINNTSSPIIALITVTPVNGADCDGSPDEFTITVEPTPTVLGVAGTLAPLTTVYGTASAAESFAVSCNTIDAKILITPPTGFEVSSDGTTFSPTITVTSTISNAPVIVYIRLESTDHVGAYGPGDVTISNPNAEKNASITMPEGSVTRAPLTITADNKTKAVGANNPALTASYSGFVNKDGPAQLTALPGLSTIATATSAVGQYAIDISGADSPDYNINYDMGVLTVVPSLSSSSIPNTFTPNGDGKNDTWVVTDLQYYPKVTVNIFNRFGQKLYTSVGYPIPWDGKYKGKVLPSGTYYYIIDPKNGEPVLAGWVAIIR